MSKEYLTYFIITCFLDEYRPGLLSLSDIEEHTCFVHCVRHGKFCTRKCATYYKIIERWKGDSTSESFKTWSKQAYCITLVGKRGLCSDAYWFSYSHVLVACCEGACDRFLFFVFGHLIIRKSRDTYPRQANILYIKFLCLK